jgi:hypothetical protein
VVTFAVDDVTPAAEPLPTRPLSHLLPDALAIGGDPAMRILEPNGVHPLLSAVGQAFAEHRPLILSPDAVWLTIAQGVAQHVRLHAEELRPRLVGHTGRERIIVDGPTDCQHAVAQWTKQLPAEADLFDCDFSTSTDVERTAARVVMLDAYSPYFSVWLRCVCGIPSITLTGTVRDWQTIRARVDRLADFGVETWRRSLAPIMDQFVRAADGDVDTAFWQRIYNPVDAYGGDVVTGWAARFYPYLAYDGEIRTPNPLLDLPIGEPRDSQDPLGIRTDDAPATLSRVIVNVNDQIKRENRVVALHAGLVGVAQDGDGALRPVAGWHVTPAVIPIDDVIDRIVAEHVTTPSKPPRFWAMLNACADLAALYRRIGSASLFDGAWRLLPERERGNVWRGRGLMSIETVIDLTGGRFIGVLDDGRSEPHWVACRIEGAELLDEPRDVRVYGTSLAMLLDAALDSGGDIAVLETGRLDELDRAGHDQ